MRRAVATATAAGGYKNWVSSFTLLFGSLSSSSSASQNTTQSKRLCIRKEQKSLIYLDESRVLPAPRELPLGGSLTNRTQ